MSAPILTLPGLNKFALYLGKSDAWQIRDLLITGIAYSAAPEPATWATMLLGIGAIGTVLRRRRHGATVTEMVLPAKLPA